MPSPIPPWDDMDLATRLRVLCAYRGIRLSDVARAAGVSTATVIKLAADGSTSAPSLDTARRIATALEFEHVEDLVP